MTTADSPGRSLQRAKSPVGPGIQPFLGVLWAVALVALGVVAIRDALVRAGLLGGKEWAEEAAKACDNLTPQVWIVPAGAVAVIVGVVLIVTALRPRPKRGIRLAATTGIYLTRSSVQRLAKTAAAAVDGVDTTAIAGGRRKLEVDATTLAAQPEVTRERIEHAIRDRLSALETPPTVKVRIQRSEDAS